LRSRAELAPICASRAESDLAKYRNKFLPTGVKIIGYARTKMDRAEFLRRVKSYIKTPTKDMENQLDEFCEMCSYISGQYDQDEPFENLRSHIEQLEKGQKETNRIFYMALPPSVFIPVSQHLKKICYPSKGIARVIVSPGWNF
jgi:glucose-6-phosphate 1-dehydrogenase